MNEKVYIHFSIDDVLDDLLLLNNKNMRSIYEVPIYDFAKRLWERRRIKTTMNVFYEGEKGNLSEVTDRWYSFFEDNSEWLKFAFHSRNKYSNYRDGNYEIAATDLLMVQNAVKKFAGKSSISPIVRTHYFAGNEDCIKAWLENGIRMFLCADDNRGSYSLKYEEERRAREGAWYDEKRGGYFLSTDIRLEKYELENLQWKLENKKQIVIFTHAKYINLPVTEKKLEEILDYISINREIYDLSEMMI